jgi:hypothetical protein
MSNGKGSKRRPADVGRDAFYENWDRTFTNPDPRQLSLPLRQDELEQPADIQMPPLKAHLYTVRQSQ